MTGSRSVKKGPSLAASATHSQDSVAGTDGSVDHTIKAILADGEALA